MGTCRSGSPVLEPAEHDFNPVKTFVTASVASDRRLARPEARNAGADCLVLQDSAKPVDNMTLISEQQTRRGQATEKCRQTNVVTAPPSRHEEPDRTVTRAGHRLEFGRHSTLRPADQASRPPFARRLAAVRRAFR